MRADLELKGSSSHHDDNLGLTCLILRLHPQTSEASDKWLIQTSKHCTREIEPKAVNAAEGASEFWVRACQGLADLEIQRVNLPNRTFPWEVSCRITFGTVAAGSTDRNDGP